MNDKPNLTPLQSYASQYTSVVCGDFFDDTEVINGQQIVSLANVHQVNLLVVKNIFQQWNLEISKLQSPLFNYNAPEVQEVLNKFMNVLSKNISIEEEHFSKVFKQATEETLLLLIYPGYFFRTLIKSFDKKIDLEEDLYPVLKYIKVHKSFVEQFKNNLGTENQIKRKQALKILDKLIDMQIDSEAPNELLQQFEKDVPLGSLAISTSWHDNPEITDEPDGLENEPSIVDSDLDAEEDDFFSQSFESEISDEFEKPFIGVSDEEDDEDEAFIADSLKTTLDPINDNVFISNQEDILNAAIIEDFEYEQSEEDTTTSDVIDEPATTADPSMLTPENPFAGATNDLEEIALLAGDDEITLHFEEEDEEQAENNTAMYSLEEDQKKNSEEDATPIHIEEEEETPSTSIIQDEVTEVPSTSEPVEDKSQEVEETAEQIKQSAEDAELNAFIAQRMAAANDENAHSTVLDKLKSNSFKKLHGNVPLHLKFKFQNDLFGGNADEFNNALELIDQAPDYHEALALIKSRFVLKYDWDFSNETTLEFIGMVEDKYD